MCRSSNALRLTAAAAASLLLGGPETHGDEIELTGIVRDFSQEHPDFDVVPSGGYGHYAGNVRLAPDPDHRPAFVGEGFRVDEQWRDRLGHPIAPHLFGGVFAGGIITLDLPTIDGGVTFDSWNSSLGPYGGDNVGPPPDIIVGGNMPTISPPEGLPNLGDVVYDGDGTSTIDSDFACDRLRIVDGHTVRIDGNITIRCNGLFEVRDGATIELLPDASVEIYVLGDVLIQDATINEGFYEPWRFVIYHLGTGTVRIADDASVYGTIISPEGTFEMPDNASFYGTIIANDVDVSDQAGLHIDGMSPFDQCGNPITDTAGVAGPDSTGAITSSATFAEWFRDVPGANSSVHHTITLVNDGTGIYEFLTSMFHPVDDRAFGNEGDNHNYYFTYAIDASFVYDACAGQFVDFEGADDVWIFIDDKLAMDLGGISPATEQHVDFDRLGLVDGETYQLLFFFAQRQGAFAGFELRTNVPLSTDEVEYIISAMFD